MRSWKGINRFGHIMMLIIAMLLILLLLCISGCGSLAQTSSNATIIWHNGECLLFIEGLEVSQSDSVSKDWDFDTCSVTTGSEKD